MLFFAGGVILLESVLSSKAHCDNKFRQRKMSSLCIMGAVWFGAPEGISEYVSTVINQRDTRAEMTLFIWFYSEEFPCMKRVHIFLVMYWKVHFLGVVDESLCRMCNVFLSFFDASPHVPSTRQRSETRRECVTTWSGQPSTATMWRPCSSSRRSSTSWQTNMVPGEAFPQGKRESAPSIIVLEYYFSNAPFLFNTYWVSI